MEFFKQFFKNLPFWNHLSDFEIISSECSVGNPFQNVLQNFDTLINMALVYECYLRYTDMKEFLNNLWPDFEIRQKNKALVNGGYLNYMDMKKSLKNLL